MDISSCTNIEHLYLANLIHLNGSTVLQTRVYITQILSQVTSTCLKEITLELNGDSARVSHREDWSIALEWDEIVAILSTKRFAALQNIRIKWRTYFMGTRSAVEEFFDEGPFSPLVRRGIVKLEFLDLNNPKVDGNYL